MVEAKDFFNRADLQQIINFLLYGKENSSNKYDTYENRIYNISTDILEKMKCLNLEDDVYEKITNDVFSAFKIYEEVYTEIGFKMGARTLFQIMCEDEKNVLKR